MTKAMQLVESGLKCKSSDTVSLVCPVTVDHFPWQNPLWSIGRRLQSRPLQGVWGNSLKKFFNIIFWPLIKFICAFMIHILFTTPPLALCSILNHIHPPLGNLLGSSSNSNWVKYSSLLTNWLTRIKRPDCSFGFSVL